MAVTNTVEPVTSSEPKPAEADSAAPSGKELKVDEQSMAEQMLDVEWVIGVMEAAAKDLDLVRVQVRGTSLKHTLRLIISRLLF